jgi:hypothetical protein
MRKPLQLLHYELLVEKSDFDNHDFRIPHMAYNPNERVFGVKEVNFEKLMEQAAGNQQLVAVLQRLQQGGRPTANGARVSEEMLKFINDNITFTSPFEKASILLKLQRKERPFVEPIFWTFRTVWDTYSESVRNLAIDQIQFAQWLSFIDECSGGYDYTPVVNAMQGAAGAADEDDDAVT